MRAFFGICKGVLKVNIHGHAAKDFHPHVHLRLM